MSERLPGLPPFGRGRERTCPGGAGVPRHRVPSSVNPGRGWNSGWGRAEIDRGEVDFLGAPVDWWTGGVASARGIFSKTGGVRVTGTSSSTGGRGTCTGGRTRTSTACRAGARERGRQETCSASCPPQPMCRIDRARRNRAHRIASSCRARPPPSRSPTGRDARRARGPPLDHVDGRLAARQESRDVLVDRQREGLHERADGAQPSAHALPDGIVVHGLRPRHIQVHRPSLRAPAVKEGAQPLERRRHLGHSREELGQACTIGAKCVQEVADGPVLPHGRGLGIELRGDLAPSFDDVGTRAHEG